MAWQHGTIGRICRAHGGVCGEDGNNRPTEHSKGWITIMWDGAYKGDGKAARTAGTVLQLSPLELHVDAILLGVRHRGISPEFPKAK